MENSPIQEELARRLAADKPQEDRAESQTGSGNGNGKDFVRAHGSAFSQALAAFRGAREVQKIRDIFVRAVTSEEGVFGKDHFRHAVLYLVRPVTEGPGYELWSQVRTLDGTSSAAQWAPANGEKALALASPADLFLEDRRGHPEVNQGLLEKDALKHGGGKLENVRSVYYVLLRDERETPWGLLMVNNWGTDPRPLFGAGSPEEIADRRERIRRILDVLGQQALFALGNVEAFNVEELIGTAEHAMDLVHDLKNSVAGLPMMADIRFNRERPQRRRPADWHLHELSDNSERVIRISGEITQLLRKRIRGWETNAKVLDSVQIPLVEGDGQEELLYRASLEFMGAVRDGDPERTDEIYKRYLAQARGLGENPALEDALEGWQTLTGEAIASRMEMEDKGVEVAGLYDDLVREYNLLVELGERFREATHGKVGEVTRQRIQVFSENFERARRLLEEVKAFLLHSEMEWAGDPHPVARSGELDAVVRELVGEASILGPLPFEGVQGLPPGRVTQVTGHDVRLIRSALQNFFVNAWDYRDERRPLLLGVWARYHPEDNALEMSVRDNGKGIAQEKQGQLFKAGKRLGSGAAASRGSGEGLAGVKRRMESRSGKLWLAWSEKGVGSEFRFHLPLENPLPVPAQPFLAAQRPPADEALVESEVEAFLQRVLSDGSLESEKSPEGEKSRVSGGLETDRDIPAPLVLKDGIGGWSKEIEDVLDAYAANPQQGAALFRFQNHGSGDAKEALRFFDRIVERLVQRGMPREQIKILALTEQAPPAYALTQPVMDPILRTDLHAAVGAYYAGGGMVPLPLDRALPDPVLRQGFEQIYEEMSPRWQAWGATDRKNDPNSRNYSVALSRGLADRGIPQEWEMTSQAAWLLARYHRSLMNAVLDGMYSYGDEQAALRLWIQQDAYEWALRERNHWIAKQMEALLQDGRHPGYIVVGFFGFDHTGAASLPNFGSIPHAASFSYALSDLIEPVAQLRRLRLANNTVGKPFSEEEIRLARRIPGFMQILTLLEMFQSADLQERAPSQPMMAAVVQMFDQIEDDQLQELAHAISGYMRRQTWPNRAVLPPHAPYLARRYMIYAWLNSRGFVPEEVKAFLPSPLREMNEQTVWDIYLATADSSAGLENTLEEQLSSDLPTSTEPNSPAVLELDGLTVKDTGAYVGDELAAGLEAGRPSLMVFPDEKVPPVVRIFYHSTFEIADALRVLRGQGEIGLEKLPDDPGLSVLLLRQKAGEGDLVLLPPGLTLSSWLPENRRLRVAVVSAEELRKLKTVFDWKRLAAAVDFWLQKKDKPLLVEEVFYSDGQLVFTMA